MVTPLSVVGVFSDELTLVADLTTRKSQLMGHTAQKLFGDLEHAHTSTKAWA
jgi:hypothetical protein